MLQIDADFLVLGFEFVYIPRGNFTMGSNEDFSIPVRDVYISKPFLLGKYPVTQLQWETVMNENPSQFECSNRPVEKVSYRHCKQFISMLNAIEKVELYRIPNESEWEYACKAQTITKYHFGDDSSLLSQYAWYEENSNKRTHPVGTLKPNPWGLFDMLGNVNEWCDEFIQSEEEN